MKPIRMIIAIALISGLVGCSVPEADAVEDNLVGSWESTAEAVTDETVNKLTQSVANKLAEAAWGTLELRADKTCSIVTLDIVSEGTWKYVNTEVTFKHDAGNVTYTFTVSADGSELRPTEGTPKVVYTKIKD